MAKQTSSFSRNTHGNPQGKPFAAKPSPQPKVTGLPSGFKKTVSQTAANSPTGATRTVYTNTSDSVKSNKFNP